MDAALSRFEHHPRPETTDSEDAIEEASHRRKRRRRIIQGYIAPLPKDDVMELSSNSSDRLSSPNESTPNREKKTESSLVHKEIDPLGLEVVIIEDEIKMKEIW